MTNALEYTIGGDEVPVKIKDKKTGKVMNFELRLMSDVQYNQLLASQKKRVDLATGRPLDVDFVAHDILTLTLFNLDANRYVNREDLAAIPAVVQDKIADEASKLNGVDVESQKKRRAT